MRMLISKIIKPKIVLKNGRPQSVVLTMGAYRKLLEFLEDKEDAAELESIKKNKTSFRGFDEYLKKRV